MEALDQRCQAGIPIVIYPEAHIWPFYTRIRNFPQTSFQYPIREGKPAFSFTTVYRKRKIRKTPKIVVKVDGPFWAEGNLPMKLAAKRLRDQVFDTMVVRAEESDCEYIKYVYSPET